MLEDDPRPPADKAPPLFYIPSGDDIWEMDMMGMLKAHNALIFMDERKDYHIRGDGIRLFLPFDWIVMCPDENLVEYVRQGIKVSLENRELLGY